MDEINDFWITDPNISLDATFSRRESIGDVSPYLWESLLKMYFKIFGYIPETGRYVPLFFGILSIPFIGILSYQVKKDNSFLLAILLTSINNGYFVSLMKISLRLIFDMKYSNFQKKQPNLIVDIDKLIEDLSVFVKNITIVKETLTVNPERKHLLIQF